MYICIHIYKCAYFTYTWLVHYVFLPTRPCPAVIPLLLDLIVRGFPEKLTCRTGSRSMNLSRWGSIWSSNYVEICLRCSSNIMLNKYEYLSTPILGLSYWRLPEDIRTRHLMEKKRYRYNPQSTKHYDMCIRAPSSPTYFHIVLQKQV